MGRLQIIGVNDAFWAGRKVFVTGHTGFLGGWLCVWLNRLGAEVMGYALAPKPGDSLYDALGLGQLIRSDFADIADRDRLTRAMHGFAPDIVLHLAAQPLVRRAFAEPTETFATNLMGTVNLMDAIRACDSVRASVIVTTDKVYDNREWVWGYRETDRLGGHEPYGASKACAELALDSYRRSYFSGPRQVGIASLRAGNIIGGGDWAEDRLIPDAVRAFTAGQPLAIRNPDAVRPWQHVLEPVRGMLMLTEKLFEDPDGWAEGWNFGPAEDGAQTVGQITEALAAHWGPNASWRAQKDDGAAWRAQKDDSETPENLPRHTGDNQAKEAKLLTLSAAKADARLGWRPRWTLERALGATVDWYKSHLAGDDMLAVSQQQIASYAGANA